MIAARTHTLTAAISLATAATIGIPTGHADENSKPKRPRFLADSGHYPAQHSAEKMQSDLSKTPEVSLFRSVQGKKLFEKSDILHPVLAEFEKRPDLRGLPVIRGEECQLSPNEAHHLGEASRAFRDQFFRLSEEFDRRAVNWKRINSELKPSTVEFDGALVLQLLQCEHSQFRSLLNQRLAASSGPVATKALAHRCVFELDPQRRDEAVRLLKPNISPAARQFLLDALRHPYAPFADHAAAALIVFQDRASVPYLVALLDASDPNSPSTDEAGNSTVPEVIRINHARNCQLCHAPSWDAKDPARVAVPSVSAPLPPTFSPAYYSGAAQGEFVRADITYLRQDFSLAIPVQDPGPWPKIQRFDFFIRHRDAFPWELQRNWSGIEYPQRYAVLRALRRITNRDFGVSAEDWREGLRKEGGFKI